MRLHGDPAASGNVYKVRLLCALLGRDVEVVPTDFLAGETDQPWFRALNPEGRVPVLEDDAFVLWESGAILAYLAQGTPWLPEEPHDRARVLQWMFWEQYSHEPAVAVSRYLLMHAPDTPERAARLAGLKPKAQHALGVMDGHLEGRDWFVGDRPTVADVALYAYTHRAHEAGLDLAPHPNVRRWLAAVEALPGYVPMVHALPATTP